jgi:hypothetical protein
LSSVAPNARSNITSFARSVRSNTINTGTDKDTAPNMRAFANTADSTFWPIDP